ncbi:hypothetical protein T4D_12762, partial [Trichinella pseudospiralis]
MHTDDDCLFTTTVMFSIEILLLRLNINKQICLKILLSLLFELCHGNSRKSVFSRLLWNGKGTDHREVVLQDDVIKDFDAARFVVLREMGKDYPVPQKQLHCLIDYLIKKLSKKIILKATLVKLSVSNLDWRYLLYLLHLTNEIL